MVIELLFMGAAYHTDPDMNNINPGLGIQAVFSEEKMQDHEGVVQAYGGLAVYKDSYSDRAIVGGVGLRGVFGDPLGLHYGPDLFVGYRSAETTPGAAAVPSAFIGYRSVNVHAAIMSPELDAFGAYLRYEVRF